jgi:hypothetical protein
MSLINLFFDALIIFVFYVLYLICTSWIFIILFYIRHRHETRGQNKIVDDFYKYVQKGRKRIPNIAEAATPLSIMILLMPWLGLPIWLLSKNLTISYIFGSIACIAVSYAVTLYYDRMKSNRHNGVAIGYEYPHPVEKSDKLNANQQPVGKNIVYAGSKGVYCLPLMSEPSPHVMIIGKSGEGKSTTMETFLARTYAKYSVPFLIIDWSGTYKELGSLVNIWSVPGNLRVNPLLLRSMSKEKRAGIAAEVLQFSLELTNMQTQRVRETLYEIYCEGNEPTIQMLYERVSKSIETERFKDIKVQVQYVANKLRQAFEVFGNEPEDFWSNYDKTCCVVELEGLTDMEKGLVTYSILQRVIEEFKNENKVKLYIALDDAYQVLKSKQYEKETPVARIVREGRKYGFGLVIATQMLKDLPDAVIANTSVKFIHAGFEPWELKSIHSMLRMTEMQKLILHRMPVGNCLLYDENALQQGKIYASFIQLDKLDKKEQERLLHSAKKLKIESNKQNINPLKKRNTIAILKENNIELPSVTIYRFLFALYSSNNDISNTYKLLKQKQWISSDTTIYGTKSKPSLIERTRSGNYIDANNMLTKKALDILDPKTMVAKQGMTQGSEEHKELMENIIRMIQEKGNFPFVPAQNDSFDVGEISVDTKSKQFWDYRSLKVYEAQTNSIKNEIDKCIERCRSIKAELVFATNNEKVKDAILQLTGKRFGCICIQKEVKVQG